MSIFVAALLIGVVAGMRALLAPAIVAWALVRGWLPPAREWLAFMGYRWTHAVFSVLALGELVTDQLPSTPSRKVPVQFTARILMGALAGATIGSTAGQWPAGLVLGAVGAVIGTLGGAAARGALARAFSNDHAAALVEDAVAIGLGLVAVSAF